MSKRRCPKCGQPRPAGDFLPFRDGRREQLVCFACHARLTGKALDELGERAAREWPNG